MSRTYWRVSPAFWGDEKVTSWDDDAKMLALYLLTCEHRTTEGLFRLPIGYILTDLGWVSKRFRNPFETLVKDGFAEYDDQCSVVFLVNALAYQSPENPNQIKGAIARLEELPETPLLLRLYEQALILCPPLAETLSKPFRNRFETLTQTLSKPPALTPALPTTTTTAPEELSRARAQAEAVVAIYHELCPDLPHVSELTDARKRQALALLKRCGGEDQTRGYFAKVAASDFLMGRKNTGREWRASFDWLVKPEHVPKILEGTYDDRDGAGAIPAMGVNSARAVALGQRYEEEDRNGQG